jgi:hypothetical protein
MQEAPTGQAMSISGLFFMRTLGDKIVEFSARVFNPFPEKQQVWTESVVPTRVQETLLTHSIEAMLSPQEVAFVLREMEVVKANMPHAQMQSATSGTSVHARSGTELFEPQGRIEINRLPRSVIEVLDAAFYRWIEDIRRAFPDATWPNSWFYCEYAPSQFCASHIDGNRSGSKVSGCTLRLDSDAEGGEFFVETSGSEFIWTQGKQGLEPNAATLFPNDVFNAIPKTRWIAQQSSGTALLYGGHLTHGTLPVRRGVVKKVLAFVYRGCGRGDSNAGAAWSLQ